MVIREPSTCGPGIHLVAAPAAAAQILTAGSRQVARMRVSMYNYLCHTVVAIVAVGHLLSKLEVCNDRSDGPDSLSNLMGGSTCLDASCQTELPWPPDNLCARIIEYTTVDSSSGSNIASSPPNLVASSAQLREVLTAHWRDRGLSRVTFFGCEAVTSNTNSLKS